MSTQASDTQTSNDAQLDVLGDECARTILVATSERPQTAKELTALTDSSSATVYRRINNLLESGLIEECIRFEADSTHTTAYQATADTLRVTIGPDGIDVCVDCNAEDSSALE